MRILVTGHAGFIGSALTNRLLSLGHTVTGIDNFSRGSKLKIDENFSDRLISYSCDLLNQDRLSQILFRERPSIVFHLAAKTSVPESFKDPRGFWENNVTATNNLLEVAIDLGVDKFVFASSSSVYGNCATLNTPESSFTGAQQLSPYAFSKAVCERTIRFARSHRSLNYSILRFFNVYDRKGGGRGVIDTWINAAKSGGTIAQYGNTIRDYTHVEDIVTACVLAMGSSVSDTYNIGSGEAISLSQLATNLKVNPLIGPARMGDIQECSADISKARSELGYTPVHSGF